MNLETAAAELSVLPPAAFVARRGDLSKQARADGDRELAAAVKRLTKPSVAAWAVNLLATRRPGELKKVVALGAEFRDAAAEGGHGALAALAPKRRTVLRNATASAIELAEQAQAEGPQPSPAVAADVEQTLQAVLADPAAAAAARTGRLVRALVSNGVEAVDLDGAVSGPFEAPEPAEAGADDDTVEAGASADGDEPGAEAEAAADDDAPERADEADTEADEAARAARDARQALESIEEHLGQLTELRNSARDESESLADEIDDLEARVADLTRELDDRRTRLSELEDRLDETDREYGRLQRQRDRAAKASDVAARAAERSPNPAPAARKKGATT